jgi:hypothetical protein
MRTAIATVGCKINQYDSVVIGSRLEESARRRRRPPRPIMFLVRLKRSGRNECANWARTGLENGALVGQATAQ